MLFRSEVIKEGKRTFIYAGGGVSSCDAVEEFKKFAELVDARVSLSLMGQCAFDNADKRYIGMLGMHGTKTSSLALQQCDLMIVLGSRLSDRVSCNPNTFAQDTKIIHIDIDPAEINKNIQITYNVIGNLDYILHAFNNQLEQQNHNEWLTQVMDWKQRYPLDMEADDEEAVLPYDILRTLDKLTDGKAVLTTEVGQHQMWTAEFYDFQ